MPPLIDPRGPRLGAWVTTLVLSAVLLTGSVALLAVQAVVFALGAGTGVFPPAVARALAAAFLNAAFGVCLGCELYLLIRRTTTRTTLTREGAPA